MTSALDAGRFDGIDNEAFDDDFNEDVIKDLASWRSHDSDALCNRDVSSTSEARDGRVVVDVWPDQRRTSTCFPNGRASFDARCGRVGDDTVAAGRREADEDLDICDVDFEIDQMHDNDDVDDDDEDDVSDDEQSTGCGKVINHDNDIAAATTAAAAAAATSGRRGFWSLVRCSAEARFCCSKFGRSVQNEADEVKCQVINGFRRLTRNPCCTVDKLARRLPIMRWLPKYRYLTITSTMQLIGQDSISFFLIDPSMPHLS